jgi:signal peptidase I
MESSALDKPNNSVSTTPSKIIQVMLDGLQTAALSLLLFLAVSASLSRVRIESISMEPTLYRGEFVLINKIAVFGGDFRRGDVIVFKYPPDPNIQYIKRIIGLPGDQVLVSAGRVYVNGNLLSEPYLMASPTYIGIWHIPAGSYFVLGDNRNRSNDSHVWGMVPRENIVGKAELIYWPPEEAGFISSTQVIPH